MKSDAQKRLAERAAVPKFEALTGRQVVQCVWCQGRLLVGTAALGWVDWTIIGEVQNEE